MKALLNQLGIEAQEGRHIFEYEPVTFDWWDELYSLNYEIELIFGEEANIFLFYFVPDSEGFVERSLILVSEFDVNQDQLLQALISEEVKDIIFKDNVLDYDENQGGYLLPSTDLVLQAVDFFMTQLKNKAYLEHSELASVKDSFEDFDYELGDIFSHLVAMYFMNHDDVKAKAIEESLSYAQQMEGEHYIDALKADVDFLQSEEGEIIKKRIIAEQEELTENDFAQFISSIIDYNASEAPS